MSKNRHCCKKKTWFSALKEASLTERIFAGKDIRVLAGKEYLEYLQEKILEYLQEKGIRVRAGKRY